MQRLCYAVLQHRPVPTELRSRVAVPLLGLLLETLVVHSVAFLRRGARLTCCALCPHLV